MKKVIKFWAPWCGPCKIYARTFDRVKEKYQDQVEVIEINVDEDSETAAKFNVRNIPFTVLVKEDGSTVSKAGILSEQQLEELFLS